MTNYKEILRVTAQGLSQRNTALACGVSRNTVMDVDRRCRIQQLTWAEAQNMGNEEIKNRLFPNDRKQRDQTFRLPDFAHIHAELAKPHVTLMLLWEEYCQASRKAGERHYQYTQFRKYYADYAIRSASRHIVDEWLLFPITVEESKILSDLIDRRNRKASTIVVSQFEPGEWVEQIPNPVAAEALTDRLKSNGYRLFVDGDVSMRERYGFQ